MELGSECFRRPFLQVISCARWWLCRLYCNPGYVSVPNRSEPGESGLLWFSQARDSRRGWSPLQAHVLVTPSQFLQEDISGYFPSYPWWLKHVSVDTAGNRMSRFSQERRLNSLHSCGCSLACHFLMATTSLSLSHMVSGLVFSILHCMHPVFSLN